MNERISEVVPNDYPDSVMPDDKLTPLFRMGIRHAIEEAQAKGIPIARYDNDLKRAYREHPDGRREYTAETAVEQLGVSLDGKEESRGI